MLPSYDYSPKSNNVSPISTKGVLEMTMSVPSRQPGGYGDVASPFAMDDQAFRTLAYQLVDIMGAYLEALPGNPVYRPLPGEVRREIEEMELPAEGVKPGEILEFFTGRVL